MKIYKIKKIKAREILDSRGNPTIEVDLFTDLGVFQASVPSGISKGKYEALELRDAEKRYQGKGVLKAVRNVNKIIAPKLKGENVIKQKEIDDLLIELDGTEQKSKLGANAILAVSLAVCRAGARAKNLALYQYLNEIYRGPASAKLREDRPLSVKLPSPSILMIEGGSHAGNDLDIQEFMIVPQKGSFREKLQIGTEIYHILKTILKKKYGESATNIGQEGGFAPPLKKNEEALDLLLLAIEKAGYKNKIKIILDAAASVFYQKGIYKFEGMNFTRENLLKFYSDLNKKYPILGIEDPFSENDWQGWEYLNSKVKSQKSKILIIGDDLTVTNPERIKMAKEKELSNAIIIKPNQIGTITETLKAVKLAKKYNWKIIVSHRAGETNDDFIADLAVGVGADFIKAGSPCRGERLAKYNRLLKIEEELKVPNK